MLLSLGVVSLSSCANTQPPSTMNYTAATPVVTYPKYVSVPAADNVKLVSGQDPALEKAFKQYTRTGKAPNIISDGFLTLAYNQSQQPIIQTMPFQETVVSLEPGEKFTNISSGDPGRWSYSVAQSGQGAMLQQHVLIKPSEPNLATNLVVTTDRRIYNLRLISSNKGTPTRDVRFWYPSEMTNTVNALTKSAMNAEPVSTASKVNVEQMNFNYSLSSQGGGFWSAAPSWKPTQVFDDGTHTFIQFPANISSGDLPALFVLDNGEQTLVNYRQKAPYFVVDKVFKQAVLVMGVGSDKRQVTINNLSMR